MARSAVGTHPSIAWLAIDPSVLRRSGVAAVLAVACLSVLALQLNRRPAATVSADFHSRLDAYVELRRAISERMGPLRVTSQPADILTRELALGAAIQSARHEARQGDVFTTVGAEDVRRIIAADWMRRPTSSRVALMSEVAPAPARVNARYPPLLPLATFPALLLDALPPLPVDLEYRFMGRALVLRDVESNLIVDIVPDVISAGGRAER